MIYCVRPGCANPQNPNTEKFCLSCGSKLLLRERYRPVRPLGWGGFGRTFLAVDEDIPSKRRCVVKQFHFLDREPENLKKATQLFHQEAIRLDELGKHPQIPSLLAHFEQERWLYLVQEFIDGKTLKQELQQEVYSEARVWEFLQNLLPVLQFIHKRKIIHRDIKPENIIHRSSERKPVLIDFGIAKLLTDTAVLRTGTAIGSQQYAAPEQVRGKVLPASDLYSLGVTCIQLLTGVSPLDMYDIGEQQWYWRQHLPQGKSVSDRLGRILDKLLEARLRDRYESAEEVLADLRLTYNTPTQPLIPPSNAGSAAETIHPSRRVPSLKAGIDCTKLQHLLEAQDWKQADRETWFLLCQSLGHPPDTLLESGEFNQLPCQDLQAIDRLWVHHSQGHFGFSVQKQIYESVGEDYVSFCDRVGWTSYRRDDPYQGMQFSLQSSQGHLPSRIWAGGTQWWRHADAMASRWQACAK